MSTLIAIGYPDESTAAKAAEEAERLASDLIIQPDAIAVIRRDEDGKFHVTTSQHPIAGNVSWGLVWGLLFGMLFFLPLFGMVVGAGLGALMGLIEKTDIDAEFQQRVRDMLQPGTSALFLIAHDLTLDRTIDALSKYGGTVLKSSLSAEAEARLQEALRAASAAASPAAGATTGDGATSGSSASSAAHA